MSMQHVLLYFIRPTSGSVIAVHGDMDDNGYYMATFEGKTGLVPANFIQEMKMDDKKAHKRLLDQVSP